MLDQWTEIKTHFMREDLKETKDCNMTMSKYYSDNKYALWLDLRIMEEHFLHGSGKALQNTKDGIQLAITKEAGKGPYKMYIFIVSDATADIQNSQIVSVKH
jgi:hypothetical protein